jgi:hypothetical protein
MGGRMKYKVCFDGRWQGTFAPDDALAWAKEVAETGRLVVVARRRWHLGLRLIAVFPEDRAEEGQELWRTRAWGFGGGAGSAYYGP